VLGIGRERGGYGVTPGHAHRALAADPRPIRRGVPRPAVSSR